MRTTPMIRTGEPSMPFVNPCAVCGRELTGKQFVVHVINGGGEVLHPDDEFLYEPDGGDLGCHYIGPECRKKFGKFATPA